MRLPGNICQPADARFVVWRDSVRSRRQSTRTRLAASLKVAIETLQGNIRKLERTNAHPLLIAARKRELRKMQDELSELRPEGARWKDGKM